MKDIKIGGGGLGSGVDTGTGGCVVEDSEAGARVTPGLGLATSQPRSQALYIIMQCSEGRLELDTNLLDVLDGPYLTSIFIVSF